MFVAKPPSKTATSTITTHDTIKTTVPSQGWPTLESFSEDKKDDESPIDPSFSFSHDQIDKNLGSHIVPNAPVIVEPVSTDLQQRVLNPGNLKIPFETGAVHTANNIADAEIIATKLRVLESDRSRHVGYPENMNFDYSELNDFLGFHLNNCGDPRTMSNYSIDTRDVECAMIDFFARLWKFAPDTYWGYGTASGTEGNFQGILMARERFPDGILYTSSEAHYSVFKATRFFKIDCEVIPSTANGEMNYDALAEAIAKNSDRSVIICANIGTTFKGAVDDIDKIAAVLDKAGIAPTEYHLHLDGALNGAMIPFVENAPEINFATKPIDSIAVSGHKFIGSPVPCGVCLCRKEYVESLNNYVQYITTYDNTILGSRSGLAPLYLWYALRKKGMSGLQADVDHCMSTSQYLVQQLKANGFAGKVHPFGITVCFEQPKDDKLIKRWLLSCQDGVAHIVVMQNISCEKVDIFISEFVKSTEQHGRVDPDKLNPYLLAE